MRKYPIIVPLPPDALARLDDPRLIDVEEESGLMGGRRLEPLDPPFKADSAYLQLADTYGAGPGAVANWINEPDIRYLMNCGRGRGFEGIAERPRIQLGRRPPKQLHHLWPFKSWWVASPDMVELLEQHSPGSIEVLPIDWIFGAGQRLQDYVFLDVVALEHAHDYRRSEVIVRLSKGQKRLRLGNIRSLRRDLPATLHLFCDADTRATFVSRTLAAQIKALARDAIRFYDVQIGMHVAVAAAAERSNPLKARLLPAAGGFTAPWDHTLALRARIDLLLTSLLDSNNIAAAEAVLIGWLRAVPHSEYHVACELAVTTTPQAAAEYLDQFCLKASKDHPPGALYAELNDINVNTDLWFCSIFGFTQHGGDETHDWLGTFKTSDTGRGLVLTGLEPLQSAFADDADGAEAKQLAEALVVIKFQRLLQQAIPHMQHLQCPLLVGAHGRRDWLVELGP